MLRSHICNIGQLLELSPNELENIPNLGKSSAKEIASFIHFQLKENKKQYCAFIENGGEPVLSNDDIEQLLLDMYNGADFYGFSFKEFRERIPESVSDEELKKAVSEMLRSGFIEYVDFRCYKVYPKFCELVKDKSGFSMLTGSEYDILLGRFAGKTLQELADERDLTRERIRQVLLKIFRKIVNYAIANNIVFDEDYYRYLYENYSIDRAAWKNELGCSEQICSYLDMCYKKGKNTDLNDALRDNNVTVNLKYRLQKVIDRNKIRIGNLKIDRKRKELVSFILKKYCHNDISFDDFVKLYNDMMKKYNVPFDESIYITDNSLKTQANIISRREDVLWKYGGTIRYYDRSEYDYTLLLDTLDLSRYKNTERSTYKWIMDYPDLMKEYDIRDQYELHIILKAVVDRDTVHDIDFSRQPIIRFGTFDREKELKELLAEVSPIDTDSLVKVIQERYGYSEAMVRVNCLGSLSEFFNNGIYTSAFKWLSNEQISSLKLLLTEDYYSIDEITAIYSEAFPNESPDDINPLTLKQLGFTVNNRYVIQNFPSADKYFRYILGKDDISDISALRKKYSEAYNTFSAILKRMLTEYEIFYFEPDQTINIRRLEKLGITKNTIVDFCDSVAGFVGNNDYFNIHSLRLRGFEHKLDDLGMDEYFYDSILTADSRFAWGQMFNKTILRKTSEKATIVRSEVITAIIKDKTVISCGEITNTLRTMYGIVLDRDHWYLFDKAVEICGMYFDRTMEKIYKDKSYYYEDIEKEDY